MSQNWLHNDTKEQNELPKYSDYVILCNSKIQLKKWPYYVLYSGLYFDVQMIGYIKCTCFLQLPCDVSFANGVFIHSRRNQIQFQIDLISSD